MQASRIVVTAFSRMTGAEFPRYRGDIMARTGARRSAADNVGMRVPVAQSHIILACAPSLQETRLTGFSKHTTVQMEFAPIAMSLIYERSPRECEGLAFSSA